MKKKLLLLLALVLIIACAGLASCDVIDNVTSKLPFFGDKDSEMTFTDVTVTYDGQPKTMAVANLPAGAVVVYSIDGGEPVPTVAIVDAGTYTVEAQITPADGEVQTMTATMTIAKADYVLENPEQYFAASQEILYDGSYHAPEPIVPLPAGLGYMLDAVSVINPGDTQTYNITFAFVDPAMERNYNPPADIKDIQLTVVKAPFDMSGVVFEDVTVPYDGKPQAHKATGVSDKLRVTYTYRRVVESAEEPVKVAGTPYERGVYIVTATFAFVKPGEDGKFYELPAPMTAKLTIGAGVIDLDLDLTQGEVAYSETADFYPIIPDDIEGIAGHEVVVKKGDVVVEEIKTPGVYTVTISFTVSDSEKYLTPDPITYTLTVTKGVLLLDAPTWGPAGGQWGVVYGDSGYFNQGQVPVGGGVELALPDRLEDCGAEVKYVHTLDGKVVEEFTEAGLYTTTAIITLEHDLWVLPEGYSAGEYTWLVVGKEIEGVVIEGDETVTYDGEGHDFVINYKDGETLLPGITGDPTVTVKLNGVVVDLPEDGFVNAGTYEYTITFPTDLAAGYAPLTITKTLTIEKATIHLSGAAFAWDLPETPYYGEEGEIVATAPYFAYDGKKHTVALTKESIDALGKEGVTVVGYEGNAATDAGEYTAKVILACDDNHVLSIEGNSFAWYIVKPSGDAWGDIVA